MSAHLRPGPTRKPWTAALTAVAVGLLATTAAALPGETGHIAFSRDGDIWAADPDGTDEVRLTSGPEDERWPRWSPEGNRIAAVREGDLVLLRATGTQLRRLTTHGDVLAAPSWSPDGRYLAYVRGSGGIAIVDATQADSNGTRHELGAVRAVAWNLQDAGQIAYTEGGAVFTVRPDGSDAGIEIVAPDPEGRTREELAWDPLTGQVVFTSAGPDGTRIEGAGISLAGAEGDDRSPVWSAGGQHMFFTRGDTLHVYERDQVTIQVRPLGTIGATPDVQPSLVESAAAYETGTGTQVSFRVRSPGMTPTIVAYQTVPAMGSATAGTDYVAESGEVTTPDAFGNAVVVPIFVFGDSEPEPDETFYVDFTFPSDPAAPLRVRGAILNDDGGRNGVITCTADQAAWALDPVRGGAQVIVGSAGSAAYSPGADRLAYLGSEAGQVQLVVADPSGAPQATFPVGGAFDHEIVWSPDGARLAWTVGAALWVADLSHPASARFIATDAVTPSWSNDTGPGPRRLAFARVATGTVCTVREDGSDESCLTAGFQPQWSPDNTTIAFLRGDVGVFLMNPDGTNERLAASATGTLEGTRLLRWSPRGGSFAFTTGSALFVGQEGSPAASVPGLPAPLWGFDWSPDGRQLVVQGTDSMGQSQLWIAAPDDAGVPFAAVRQATTGGGGSEEPRWSTVPVRPTAGLASRGGFERFGQARVEVQLDAPSRDMVVLTWQTVETGSATADVDFTSGTGTVALQPGETTGTIVVPVLDDMLAEGPESFDLRLTDAAGARIGSESRVDVFITDDDGVPVAVPDVAATALDTPVDIPVLDNDSDPDGDPVSLTGVDHPAHGTATLAGDLVTYSPQPGFEGADHFRYSISDGLGHSATGLVSVYVGMPLPPAAVLTVTPPFLDFGKVPLNKTRDLVVTVTNNTAEPVALAEVFPLEQADPHPFDVSDFEGLQACRAPAARVLEPGQSCTQKVRFWSVPGAEAASPATVRLLEGVTFETLGTIALFASTGPPDTGPNLPPVAVDDLAGVAPGFTHTLDAVRNDSDPDHDIVRITAVSDPPHGTTAVVPCQSFPQNPNADCVRYVPDAGYTGTDAFLYTVSDGRGGDATATFHLAVGNVVPQVAAITPVSGPIAGGQAVRISGSGFVYRSEAAFLCPSGQLPLEVSQLTDTEILATTPPAPGGVCAVRVRTLFGQQGQLVNAYRYNSAPLAQDGAVSTNEDAPVTIALTATDAEGDPLTFTIVSGPGHGALSAVTGAQATYTPAADYNGPDSFTFRASDGQADSNVATVSIIVHAPATRVLSVTKAGSGGGDVTFTPPGIMAVVALAAGFSHACAIRDDGTVACWGGNSLGQANAPGGTFRSVAAGLLHTCGVQTDGTAVCWGDATWGDPPTGAFASVSAGRGHTCGLRADGNLTCWGRNDVGQATAPPGLYGAVSAGGEHTCAIRNDGTLVCWGGNVHGQRTAPAGTFQSLAAGDLHTCAVRTDGTVACWGYNLTGQAAPPPGTFASVAAGLDHSCGLRSDGVVVCWGDNLSGEATPPAGAFTAVATGWNYTCATRSSGALACWGQNNHGQTAAPAGDFLAACPTCRVYPADTVVTLWAIPDPGSAFDGWSGDCLGTGTCTVTMDQDRSVTVTFVAATATPTTTTVTTSGSPSLPGQTVTFTATVTSAGAAGPTPEGQVHFEDATAGTPLGTVPLDASGSATLQTSALAAGTHTIQATYLPAAGQTYAGSSGVVIQVVDANVPPVAVDDGPFSVLEVDTLTVTPPGVLANDADPELAALTARIVTAPAHGVLFLRPSGGFDYTPGVGYVGTDSFTYVANDGYADSNVATVSLTVHPRVVVIHVTETVHVTDTIAVDPAVMIDVAETIHVTDGATLQTSPRADDGTASTTEDTPVVVSLSATDADGDPFTLTIVSGPAHGTVFPPAGVVMPSGTLVTYTPAPDYIGTDSFTFKATDSQGDSNLATVAIVVHPPSGQEVVTATVPPGGTLTTDNEGDGATSEDVIETTVLTPQGGEVIIDETPAPPPPPTAFTFLPHQVQIAAPPGSASQPLLLTFLIDESAMSSAGGTLATLAVFRNGFEVPPCRPGSFVTPDPCVALRQLVDDDVRLVVRTSRASVWTFGVPRSTAGAVTGALRPLSGGTVAFAAARIHGQLVGALRYQNGSEQFLALRVSAFAVEGDGHTAWFAGLGVDGRAFLAYAEDGGADGDVFRLWIGGVDKTGDGRLASGRVVVTP